MRYPQQNSNIHVPSTILFLTIVVILSILLLVGCGKQEPTNTDNTQQTEISDTPVVYTIINNGFYVKCVVQVITLKQNTLYKLKTTNCPQSFDENKEFEVSHTKLLTLIN